MRLGSIIGVIVIVAVVIVIAMIALRPADDEALDTLPTSPLPVTSGNGQFFQEVPEVGTSDTTALPSASATSPGAEITTINITETGFSPATLTVSIGTAITFINNGQAPHWPASDVHPTHNILPDFDSKRGLETGDSYTYTFDKVGTWRCHDHLLPQNTCTIIVE
jgi:plastocyanin